MNWFEHAYPYTNVHELNLDWMIKHFHEFINEINDLEHWKSEHETQYNELLELYEEIKKNWDDFESGNFPPHVYKAMEDWWVRNAINLVGSLTRFVFFGLTENGYFTAYIPENWRDIQFDTILDPGSSDYGKLTIVY